MTFGMSTTPVRCGYFTLGNPKKSQQYFSYMHQIIYIISEENKVQLLYVYHHNRFCSRRNELLFPLTVIFWHTNTCTLISRH